MPRARVGEFEQLVLLAILRLGEGAYAPAILAEIEERTGRPAAAGSVYITLDRLEEKKLIRSKLAAGNAERGGRPRRCVAVTARGVRELRANRDALLALWNGLEGILEGA